MNELMADPQSFWKRLQVRRPKTILNESDLLEYIKQLYFFIDAGQMPFTVGGGCVFTVEEVGREIGRMKAGRAADIAGLTVELLKWCGPITLNAVTQLLTRACQAGFRKDHCAMDHALVLRVLAERARRTKRPLYVLFVDVKKAFDSVPRDLIWQRLRLIGVPNDLVNSIAALYHQVVVKSSVLYGVHIWGPSVSKSDWKKIEVLQKQFIQSELGVRVQIPYTLLLAEVGKIPLEAEGLLLAIRYVQRIKKHDRERYTYLALSESRVHGWFGDVCRWGNRWGFPEDMWSETGSLRENLTKAIVRTLWRELSPRQAYYLMDVSKLDPYDEKPYLTATISPRIRRLISRYRTSSHDLRVEVGRWSRLPGSSVLALCVRWRKWKTNTIHCLSVHDM
ncbi:hypothetical protein R1sor_001274 [Riccia sorocarpa]|uniref:Reverse transcriptase domain-containing protein n=1 Tax=Riccia sorocarpa TaxID=122646 RepID=A0ABD3GVH1_9MARC